MKRFIKSIFIFFISIHFVACEGSLDPHLYGVVDTTNAFSTSADLEASTVALYYELRQKGWGPYLFCDGSSFDMDEVATDEWNCLWGWQNFLNGAWATDDPMVRRFYDWVTPCVTRCTYTLAKMDESPVEASIRESYMAEVRALRAIFTFDLFRLYGPMPNIIEYDKAVNPDPDYRPSRPEAAEVVEFLKKELRDAADMLPIRQDKYGRVTRGAALHYLLKVHMHEKEWQDALDVANKIIGLGCYQLEKNYADIFSAQNEGNSELIFVVRAEPLADYGNHVFANILPGDFASPSGNSVEGWNGHRMPWEFYDTFNPKDLRRKLALAEYTDKQGKTVNLREKEGEIGALPLKYGIDPEAVGIWAGNDKVLDRYAEVLLFKAEALNELNGPNQESVDIINTIRKRAFGLGIPLPSFNVIKESFDVEVNDKQVGRFTLENYGGDQGAAWTFDVDGNNELEYGNAMHIHVDKSGNDFWTLQVRANDVPFVINRKYTIKFRAKSSKDITMSVRIEGNAAPITEDVVLKANEIKDVYLETGKATNGEMGTFFIALGNTGDNYDLWIDEVDFSAMEQQSDGGDEFLVNLPDFSDKEALRNWILKERGWEFWYEGKRRDDLIRMDKYLEYGKKYADNFSEKNLLFPIPASVIIENPNIKQNSGY